MRNTDKNRKMPGGKKVGSLSAGKLYSPLRPLMKFILTAWSEDNWSWEWCDGDGLRCGETHQADVNTIITPGDGQHDGQDQGS